MLSAGRIRLKKGEILDWSRKENEVSDRSCRPRWMGLNRTANIKDMKGIGKQQLETEEVGGRG